MHVFILRRLLAMIPALFITASLVFLAFLFVPGNPAEVYAGVEARIEHVRRLEREWGLDRPAWERYVKFMSQLVVGDLGASFHTGQPVVGDIVPKYGNTLRLALVSFAGASVIGLTVGTITAVKRGTVFDQILSILVVLGISMPQFWLGLLMMFLFGVQLGWVPPAGKSDWSSYILPAITMGVFAMAFIARMTRSSILEVLPHDYVRTARAKGLPERVVVAKHVLRNAMIPIVTIAGLRLGYMLGQSVVVETIFAWPGLAVLFIRAIHQRDYPMVRGIVVVYTLSFMAINLLVDVAYGLINPRIRYQ